VFNGAILAIQGLLKAVCLSARVLVFGLGHPGVSVPIPHVINDFLYCVHLSLLKKKAARVSPSGRFSAVS
jgi:hypothetical protein